MGGRSTLARIGPATTAPRRRVERTRNVPGLIAAGEQVRTNRIDPLRAALATRKRKLTLRLHDPHRRDAAAGLERTPLSAIEVRADHDQFARLRRAGKAIGHIHRGRIRRTRAGKTTPRPRGARSTYSAKEPHDPGHRPAHSCLDWWPRPGEPRNPRGSHRFQRPGRFAGRRHRGVQLGRELLDEDVGGDLHPVVRIGDRGRDAVGHVRAVDTTRPASTWSRTSPSVLRSSR